MASRIAEHRTKSQVRDDFDQHFGVKVRLLDTASQDFPQAKAVPLDGPEGVERSLQLGRRS